MIGSDPKNCCEVLATVGVCAANSDDPPWHAPGELPQTGRAHQPRRAGYEEWVLLGQPSADISSADNDDEVEGGHGLKPAWVADGTELGDDLDGAARPLMAPVKASQPDLCLQGRGPAVMDLVMNSSARDATRQTGHPTHPT
jgi:hypothetical protein